MSRLQPKVAGHPTVVLIHSPVALPPVVELTRGYTQPRNESSDVDLGLLRPAPDEIHHLIPHIMRHPGRGQSSPRLFFTRCAPPSARPGPRPWSAPSSPRTQSASVSPLHGGEDLPSFGRRPLRSRRTLFASDRTPSAAGPVLHTDRKLAPCQKMAP